MEEDSDGKNNLFNEDYEEEEEEKPAPVENDTVQIDSFYAALKAQGFFFCSNSLSRS